MRPWARQSSCCLLWVPRPVDMNHPVLLIVGPHVCASDCNPKVQPIHICVPVVIWTAILESKVPPVLFKSTKINETKP